MREAVFVCGPEASGTRMLTEAFVRAGYKGDYSHRQRLDHGDLTDAPEKIVFRRSCPHGGQFPNLYEIVHRLQKADYVVRPVIIFRDKDVTVKSQVIARHVENETKSRENIERALFELFTNFVEIDLIPVVIYYKSFVSSEKVRENFFKQFGVNSPEQMKFFNADSKYAKQLRPTKLPDKPEKKIMFL